VLNSFTIAIAMDKTNRIKKEIEECKQIGKSTWDGT
jgi:hypothetical protein